MKVKVLAIVASLFMLSASVAYADIDSDGIIDPVDNCPEIANGPDQGTCSPDAVYPGIECGDSVWDCGISCPRVGSCDNGQRDRDNDGIGDVCDNCFNDFNDTQLDNDGDGTGNACDPDDDEDGIPDGDDNCPNVANFNQIDSNSDGIGDYCDPYRWALVPKTGQTTSYAISDDGDLERGVTLVSPRFTDNSDGTVIDNQTGLIWMKDANCFGERTWANALLECNGLADGQCGLIDSSSVGDWRLPNKRELFSLTNDGYYDPAVPNTSGTEEWSEGDPLNNVQATLFYHSSSTHANSSSHTWPVSMYSGNIGFELKSSIYHVWCVRGGQ